MDLLDTCLLLSLVRSAEDEKVLAVCQPVDEDEIVLNYLSCHRFIIVDLALWCHPPQQQ